MFKQKHSSKEWKLHKNVSRIWMKILLENSIMKYLLTYKWKMECQMNSKFGKLVFIIKLCNEEKIVMVESG